MKKRISIFTAIIVTGLVMLACVMPTIQAQLNPEDIKTISDSVVQTLAVEGAQQVGVVDYDLINTAVAQTMAVLNSQVVAVPTNTAVPPAPTATPYPCNSAIMLSENYPDYTHFDLNQAFTKTWRLKNVGYCTWNTSYRLAFMSGNSMGAPSYVYLPYSVAPNGTVDISVPMQAPSSSGTYTGYWGLYSDANQYFGKIWVTLKAGTVPAPPVPLPGFAVTSVTYAIDFVTQSPGACPADVTFNIQANITTNGAGTVTYYWAKSDGTNTATQTLTYGGASTQTVLLTHTITGVAADSDYWVKIYIDNPNHQLFSPMAFHVNCP